MVLMNNDDDGDDDDGYHTMMIMSKMIQMEEPPGNTCHCQEICETNYTKGLRETFWLNTRMIDDDTDSNIFIGRFMQNSQSHVLRRKNSGLSLVNLPTILS